MNISAFDQTNQFVFYLQKFKNSGVIQYDQAQLASKKTCIIIDTKRSFEVISIPLYAYQIFPKNIMTHFTQWAHEEREMKEGDTVVQQIFIPPFKALSQKIICGVRIKEIISEPNRKGFSYETLLGHVEKGISIFTLEKIGTEVFFVIETFSAPANLLAKWLKHVFSLPYQAYCTKKALQYLKRNIEMLG
jgi:uncharacterized protein (UPF0548 family)